MIKKVKDNKGFTLIELLAVIVILGVLMIIAIPMVSRYIKGARQNAFIDTAKAYVNSARYAYLNDDYKEIATGGCPSLDAGNSTYVDILFRYIPVDKTGGKSSFGKNIDLNRSFVRIASDANGKYTYSVYMTDGTNSLDNLINEEDLTKKSVGPHKDLASESAYNPSNACKHADDYDAMPKKNP